MRVALFRRPVTFFGFLSLFLFCRESALAQLQQTRTLISLNGVWDIADSVSPYSLPTSFPHEVPVPGLARSTQPTFPDVDLFDSHEHIANLVFRKELPDYAIVSNAGVSHQERNNFWYRTRFDVPARREKAILKIAKAQFGIAVWLNGREIGEHFPCLTAATFDLTSYIRWSGRMYWW